MSAPKKRGKKEKKTVKMKKKGEMAKRSRVEEGNDSNDQPVEKASPLDEGGSQEECKRHDRDVGEGGDKAETEAGSNNTLFVRSIPYAATTDDLTQHFSFVAPVKHAHIVLDPTTKSSRGFGFVTFVEEEDAQTAMQELHEKEFMGRALKVEIAEVRHRAGYGVDGTGAKQLKPKSENEEVGKRNPRLIVRNLSWRVKKPEQLSEVFSRYGKVLDVIIPPKKGAPLRSGQLAGFAFVTMKRYRHGQKAIEEVNGMSIAGRNVAVDWAVEKEKWIKIKEGGGELDMEVIDSESDSNGDEDPEVKKETAGQDGIEEHIDDTEDRSDNQMDSDEEDDDIDGGEDEDEDDKEPIKHDNSLSLFLRNVPFSVTDQSLHAHFTEHFGPVRYARVVMDWETERPRGTAFVAFYKEEHFMNCLRNAPKLPPPGTKPSLLQSESQDPEGRYTIDGRALVVTKAVGKDEAAKLTDKNSTAREIASRDRRRLYLLSEGTIPSSSPIYQKLSPSEQAMREASIKQRKSLIQNNPSLHLSLTRLSIRNIPRSITAKDLKFLAREAVVGFAADVKGGKRQPLSKEELSRSRDEEREAETERRKKGKGVIRQVKIIEEKSVSGAGGRSRGYGFIEYVSHRWALMGLRWLNGREVGGGLQLPVAGIEGRREQLEQRWNTLNLKDKSKKGGPDKLSKQISPNLLQERKKRLIVEFALENAQVVRRRKETEKKWQEIAKERKVNLSASTPGNVNEGRGKKEFRTSNRVRPKVGPSTPAKKRKREVGDQQKEGGVGNKASTIKEGEENLKKRLRTEEESKRAAANRHIAKKRLMRKAKRA